MAPEGVRPRSCAVSLPRIVEPEVVEALADWPRSAAASSLNRTESPDSDVTGENNESELLVIPNKVFTLACWMDALAMASNSAGVAFASVAADRLVGRNPSFNSSWAPDERVAAAEGLVDSRMFP